MSPSTHSAIATTSKGVLEEIQVPTARPQNGEVLVKVEYTAMIAFDTYQTDLGYYITDYPMILGFSSAGTVEEVGPQVDDLKVGDRITAFTFQTSQQKGMQQYCVQPRTVCAKIPDSLSLEAAATIPDNFITAFRTLFTDIGLPYPSSYPASQPPVDASKPILIYGAGASSGQYAVQILKAAGYKNIIVTASPQHHAFLASLGAKAVVDYRSPTMAAQIIDAAGGARISIVMDCISADATIEAISKVIDPNGTLAILLPVKKGANVRAEGDASSMTFDTSSKFIPETVNVLGIRTFLYHDVEYLRENLMPKILPELLQKGLIQPNRVKLLDQGTLKERVEVGLDLLRNNRISGEKVVVKIN